MFLADADLMIPSLTRQMEKKQRHNEKTIRRQQEMQPDQRRSEEDLKEIKEFLQKLYINVKKWNHL